MEIQNIIRRNGRCPKKLFGFRGSKIRPYTGNTVTPNTHRSQKLPTAVRTDNINYGHHRGIDQKRHIRPPQLRPAPMAVGLI